MFRLIQVSRLRIRTEGDGSDRAVAGALVYVKTAEVQGYFWIAAVRHVYGTPHRMTMTLRRSDYTPPEGALSDDMGEALMKT